MPKHLSSTEFNDATIAKQRAELLSWYEQNKRTLPWRDIHDPWATWVSEIMLQQTRVASVLEYFDRFMTRFPTPSALADAEWDEVASLWAGLGYYSRAKNLWKGAKQVVNEHNGEVPSDPKAVLALSGVGPYTAGAILSIAFAQEAPIVDGNVIRVFTRLYTIGDNIQDSQTQKQLWGLAEAWVKGEKPGDLNQAIMELGATVCTPKVPMCLLCPLQKSCLAYQQADPLHYPYKLKKTKKRPIEVYLGLILKKCSSDTDENERYAIYQRKATGLLGGLWALPMLLRSSNSKPVKASEYAVFFPDKSDVSEFLSPKISPKAQPMVKHAFTHKEWQVWPVLIDVSQQSERFINELEAQLALSFSQLQWYSIHELDALALGGPSLKALIQAGAPLKARRGSGR